MSNFDRAVKALDAQGAYCGQCSREPGDSLNACRDCAAVLETYAHALEEAGLLAPDLPEPEIRHLEDVNTDVLAWKSDHIEVGVYKNRIAMDDPPEGSMSPVEARELAYALLAAVEYAEKEQSNEQF